MLPGTCATLGSLVLRAEALSIELKGEIAAVLTALNGEKNVLFLGASSSGIGWDLPGRFLTPPTAQHNLRPLKG